jgi:hypothetical protein
LENITRSLKVSAAPPGVAIPITSEDSPIKINQGKAQLIVTGQIVDGENNYFGELHNCLIDAISEYDQIIFAYK